MRALQSAVVSVLEPSSYLDGGCLQEGNLVLPAQLQEPWHLLGKVHNLLD